jgi:enhancing lycopene biosynthesis protein 2
MKKIAVILSGCGARDGTEIQEAVCLLLAISQLGMEYNCFSLNKNKTFVYNHYEGKKVENEIRNILFESARIARKVSDITNLKAEDFDGIAFVGGFGNAMNFSDFAIKKDASFEIDLEIQNAIKSFHQLKKPMYFLCISSVLPAKILDDAKITLGGENEASIGMKKWGFDVIHKEENTPLFDEKNKIISLPCYLLDINLSELYKGIYQGTQIFSSIL